MKQPTRVFLTANLCVWLWAGCGGQSQPVAEKSTPNPAMSAPAPVAGTPSPAGTPPPPPSGQPVASTVSSKPAGEMVDADGKQLNALQYLQQSVEYYERIRPTTGLDDSSKPWPPLTELSQLVQVGALKSLPPAPPGQKFVLDPKTLKVSLANQ